MSLAVRLNLPLPWELGQVNAYAVPLDREWMLVDCGMEGSMPALEKQLREAGIAWDQIRTVLLTHVHPDHMGLAPQILELTGANLVMHQMEFDQLEAFVASVEANTEFDNALEVAATPPELVARTRLAFKEVEKSFVRLRPTKMLDDGERIGPAQVIHTPGHSPGHICLKLDDGSLISGDHLLETITPNISWRPGQDCLAEFLDSLNRIAGMEIGTVFPAHGDPFVGHREWVRQTAAHHRERCEEILTALRIHSRTAHELVAVLWPRRFSPFHYRFAVYEVLAHLEYLRRLSQTVLGSDGRWSSTSAS